MIQRTDSKMYEFQESLPKLPLPRLEDTLQRYLEIVAPLLSETELALTKAAVMDFQQGSGAELQKQLEMIDCSTNTNYLHQFIEDSYLESRQSQLNRRTTTVASPVLTTEKYPFTYIVAIVIFNTLQFHLKVKHRELEPDRDIFQRNRPPLCMAQYDNLFGTARIPGIRCDSFQRVKKSEHIVVIRQDVFYALKLLPGDKLPTVEAIAQQLDWILENTHRGEYPVGVLTALPRSRWAVVRSYLTNLALENARYLELLDSALFVVCLDEITPSDTETLARIAFSGDGGRNRWFDKPIRFVFNSNGQFAVTIEHSNVDGYSVMRLIDEVNREIEPLEEFITSSSSPELEPPQRLWWKLDQTLQQEVEEALTGAERLSEQIQMGIAIFDKFGSDFIEQHGLIADAVFLLSLQIAYSRLHGKVPGVWEVAHTRGFRYGRYDEVLVVTPQSLEVIQAFTEGASDEVRYSALKRAVNAHLGRVFDNKNGQGVVAHLRSLYSLAHHKGCSIPDIFHDKAFVEFVLEPTIDATTIGNRKCVELCCCTPARDYGIGYILERNKMVFTVTSKHLQPEKFIEIVQQCLSEIGKLMRGYLQYLQPKLEKALLSNPLVDDCAVLIRETQTCQPELVAYIVSSLPISREQIQSQLQGIVPKALLPKAYVPVSTIPLTNTGQRDEAALASLEVIDSDLIRSIEEQLQSLSEIERVAVVVEPLLKNTSPLHLDDLLSDTQAMPAAGYANAVEDSQTQPQATTPSQKVENKCLSEVKKLAISHGERLHYPEDAPKTLGEVLQRAAQQSTKGIVYIQPDGTEKVQPYQELLQEAQRILAGLKQLGLKPQDKVIFQLEQNQDFIPAFGGCVLGGFVPVPISIAPTYEQVNTTTSKLHNTWQMLGKALVLTSTSLAPKIRGLSRLFNLENFQVETIDKLRDCEPDFNWHSSQPQDLAILLLTSGSTGTPKAVMQSHSSLIGRCAGTTAINSYTPEDVSLNWLPLDHVGGIVMFHVRDVYLGCQQIHAPTELVLQQPTRWLDWIERYRATITWAPNFAYALINEQLEKLTSTATPTWDLSSMRFVINGAEAIVAKTARRFLQLLTSYQLPASAMHPAWGMSETSSGVTFSDSFLLNSTTDEQQFVEVGVPIPGFAMRIVDTKNQVVESETIGRLQVKGVSVTSGYYQNSQANQEAFTENGWFNTGDLGFLRQGRLTITGRQKDVIIINGLNYYCHEIEASVEEVEGVEVSYTAACAVQVTGSNTDKLAIFFNPKLSDDEGLVSLLKEIRSQVVNKVGLNPDYLIPVDQEIIPKTAIGKIQRSQLSQRFNAGEFKPILKRVDILLGNANTIPDWFYRQVWKPKSPVTFNSSSHLINPTLVFLDSFGLGTYLCQILSQQNQPYITVSSGEDFRQINRSNYTIAPGKADHYRLLLESLAADNIIIGQILHLWTYDEYIGEVSSLEALSQAQEEGIYSLLFLVQALAKVQGSDHWVQLLFISSYIQSILSTDPIAYEKSTVLGLLKTVPQELPNLNCRHIDLPFDRVETNGAYILQEMQVSSKEREVAYRNGQRFVPRLEKVDLPIKPKHPIPFKQGGTYLLSGGLGGVGIQIAKYLLKHYQARILVVGRTSLPEKSNWNAHLEQGDAIEQRIKAYQELQMLGGEVIYEAVDICDLEQLQKVVENVSSRWGSSLDGVIHLAGTFHEQLVVEETQENLAAVLRPKMLGSWALHQLIKDNADSIFINFSSLHGFFGSTAVGAYAAANSFLDRFSHYQKYKSGLSSYCFAWSMWDETGMSQGYQMKNLLRAKGFHTMSSSQAISSMLAGLHHDCSHLFIGLDGSNPNIRRWQPEVVGLQKLTAYFTASSSSAVVKLPDFRVQDRFGSQSIGSLVQLREIPELDSGEIDRDRLIGKVNSQETGERVGPRNEIEFKIAQSLQEVLGVPLLSIHDNFFELGGNSLLTIQLISRLREDFSIELSIEHFFEAPTIASLALTIEALH